MTRTGTPKPFSEHALLRYAVVSLVRARLLAGEDRRNAVEHVADMEHATTGGVLRCVSVRSIYALLPRQTLRTGQRRVGPIAKCAQEAVVTGPRSFSVATSCADSSPENASIRLSGRRLSATGRPKRPRRPFQNGLAVKASRHQRRQRSSVRRGTGCSSHLWIASSRRDVAPCCRAETSTMTGATYQRRPKNRPLGGVPRRRHPSLPQQKLKRFSWPSGSPRGAPRRTLG